MRSILLLLVLPAFGALLSGAEICVDYFRGNKDNPGTKEKPLHDFAAGVKKLRPGDTLKILPGRAPVRDMLHIGELKGTPDKPIVIDGSFNIFDGAVPLDMKAWREVRPGLFRRKRSIAGNMASRYYMIHNGRGVFMGRATKAGKTAPFRKIDDLHPGEWTVVDPEPGNRKPHPLEFYLRLADGEKTPADGKWEEPSRISGVHIASPCSQKNCGHSRCGQECGHVHCSHVIFRNIIVRHFWNDGFNIHGKVKDLVFENIAAVECGDDGLSAHEAAEITVKNYVSIGNSTGICHIQEVKARHRNVYIEKTRGVDLFPCGKSENVLENTFVLGQSPRGVVLNVTAPGIAEILNSMFFNTVPRAGFSTAGKNPAKGKFSNLCVNGYEGVARAPGLVLDRSDAEVKGSIAERRNAMFLIFQGQLEKACGERRQ